MSGYNVDVPTSKWSLLEWRNPANVKPKENDRCLVIVGNDVLAARYANGTFYANNWTRAEAVAGWSAWPKAPLA